MKSFLRRKHAQAIAALVMAIVVLAALVGLGLSTSIAGAASPSNGALKTPLTTANRGCDFQPQEGQGTGGGTGFVILNKTASGKLIANVVLVGAGPSTTYNIRLIQTPTSVPADCLPYNGPGEATLTTDALGNGNANYQEAVIAGANDAFAVLNNQAAPGTDYYTTQEELFF